MTEWLLCSIIGLNIVFFVSKTVFNKNLNLNFKKIIFLKQSVGMIESLYDTYWEILTVI